MSYRVLARTYRSATFDELVGQEAIATTLKNAITAGRVHHGYLFTGTRGVGKTSMARILAKALNCLASDAPTVTPCLECESCRLVAEGEDVDVVEIDAASNTGVDNIRELRNNAAFRPARSRYKVYIIDEVHMLSKGAFNALLKTLEEPPSHVKFILATTEPEKVPATIQSRCQRFDFKAVDVERIAGHLRYILDNEKIEADDAVLRRIARLGRGSMRDALSLLDKVLSYGAANLTQAIVDELIPPPHDELAAKVMARVADRDAAGALLAFDDALQSGRTIERFCDLLIDQARTLMLIRVAGEETELVDVAARVRPELAAQAKAFDGPTYVYIITLLEELRRAVKFSGSARALADAAIVRLAMSRQFSDINELIDRLGGDSPAEVSDAPATPAVPPSASAKVATPASKEAPEASAGAGDRSQRSPGAKDAVSRPTASASQPPAPKTVTSEQMQKAGRDPMVARVKEAVDGTLFDVRAATKKDGATKPVESSEGDAG